MVSRRKSIRAAGRRAASVRGLGKVARALKTLSAGNRTLLRAEDESELLRAMCRVIVDEGGYRMACVGYAQHDERKTVLLLAPAFEGRQDRIEESLRNVAVSWGDDELGHSVAGIAIRSGEPCIGRNLLTDPNHAPWRAEAVRFGYAAASAFPLRVDGDVIGVLAICAAEPDAFGAEEAELLGELADDLAYGIANLRARARHREAQALIERMARYDSLTGLLNRESLRERLNESIGPARQQHRPLALLHLAVGRYQEISDTLGYREADELLHAIAQRLGGLVREGEILARVGEADFALLLPGSSAEQSSLTAQGLVHALKMPVDLAGLRVAARPSVGVALFPGHGADPDALIRRAKVAAYEAQRAPSGYSFYNGSLDAEFARRLALMGDLARAIEHDELLLYCQPKVLIASGEVCGAEALIRWKHPQHGMLATGEFIRFAEHAGLIAPLTQWVLDAAFRQSYRWREAGLDEPLAINLSAQDLRDSLLVDRVKGLFATWGLSPERIQFELTESALMEDPAGALETLKGLKALGVALFIDDYGTGYSSLSYLQRLPVDAIKIDQSFVADIQASDDSAAIVRSTIDLGHNLGLEVVAEGVENQGTWDRLARLECDTAQGFFVGEPMPAEEFRSWSAQWRCAGPAGLH